MDFEDSEKPDEKEDPLTGFGTVQSNVVKIIVECPDILQTAVVSN